MSNNQNVTVRSSGGTSLSTVLLVVFIVLKLTHVIDWPWVWVLSPLWIPIILLALIGVSLLIVFGIAKFVVDPYRAKKRRKAAWERLQNRNRPNRFS